MSITIIATGFGTSEQEHKEIALPKPRAQPAVAPVAAISQVRGRWGFRKGRAEQAKEQSNQACPSLLLLF